MQIGTIHHLMDMRVHGSRNPGDSCLNLARYIEVLEIVAGHLEAEQEGEKHA
jgi:hypothetical protein